MVSEHSGLFRARSTVVCAHIATVIATVIAMSARAAVLLALIATALPPACAMRTPALVAAKTRSSDAVLATGTKAASEVSVQEMEQALGIFGRVCRRLRRAWRSNRNVCLMLTGMFGLTNARRFPYSILVLQTFQATGWPLVRNGLERAGEAYASAKATAAYDIASRREVVHALRAELHTLVGLGLGLGSGLGLGLGLG